MVTKIMNKVLIVVLPEEHTKVNMKNPINYMNKRYVTENMQIGNK